MSSSIVKGHTQISLGLCPVLPSSVPSDKLHGRGLKSSCKAVGLPDKGEERTATLAVTSSLRGHLLGTEVMSVLQQEAHTGSVRGLLSSLFELFILK